MLDLETDHEWFWPSEKFLDRKAVMQEMYEDYAEGEDWKLPKVECLCALCSLKIERLEEMKLPKVSCSCQLRYLNIELCVVFNDNSCGLLKGCR